MQNIKDSIKKYSFKEILQIIDYRYGIGRIERFFASNWLNPLKTIWLNWRSFPIKQAWKLPVWVYGRPRIYCLSGTMRIKGSVTSGMITLNRTIDGAPNLCSVQSEIINHGNIIFNGKGRIGTGTRIHTYRDKTIELGSNFKIADFVNISCMSHISIGDQTRITHRCQIIDTNFHYVANFDKGIVPQLCKPISIGKGCWICNTTTIAGGTILPDFTIVASNSLVNKDMTAIPESSMIGGIPAKFIATGLRRVENSKIGNNINYFYKNNRNSVYQIDFSIEECSTINTD